MLAAVASLGGLLLTLSEVCCVVFSDITGIFYIIMYIVVSDYSQ